VLLNAPVAHSVAQPESNGKPFDFAGKNQLKFFELCGSSKSWLFFQKNV